VTRAELAALDEALREALADAAGFPLATWQLCQAVGLSPTYAGGYPLVYRRLRRLKARGEAATVRVDGWLAVYWTADTVPPTAPRPKEAP